MSINFADRVQDLSADTGTTDFTLAETPPEGYRSFDDGYGAGAYASDYQFPYIIDGGANVEVGYGHLSDATTLVRDTVLYSTNANALVDFPSGPKYVYSDLPAASIIPIDGSIIPSDGEVLTFNDSTTFWEPAAAGGGGGGLLQMETAVVDTNDEGTAQDLLSAVPSNKRRIVTQMVFRDPTASDLTSLYDDIVIYFNNFEWVAAISPADGFQDLSSSAPNKTFVKMPGPGGNVVANSHIGAEGEVLKLKFFGLAVAGSLTVDVFFVDIDE